MCGSMSLPAAGWLVVRRTYGASLGGFVATYDELQPVLRAPMSHVLSAFQIGRIYSRPRQTDEKQQ